MRITQRIPLLKEWEYVKDGTAAHIDGGPNKPGYFTDIADKPTSSISEQVAQQKTEEQLGFADEQESVQETEESLAIIPKENDPLTSELEQNE